MQNIGPAFDQSVSFYIFYKHNIIIIIIWLYIYISGTKTFLILLHNFMAKTLASALDKFFFQFQ